LSFQPEDHRPHRSSQSRESPPAPDRQAIVLRRTVAIGAGLAILVALIFGIRGCLNDREDRAFRDYAADVRGLIKSSDSLSDQFFETLSKPKGADALDIQTEVNAQRVDADQLVERAKDTDRPDQVEAGHDWLVTALEFRRDALERVAQRLPTALGKKGRKAAIEAIAGQMQALLASDVIYLQRALPDLRREFKERGLDERFSRSRFLPSLSWLAPDTVDSRLSRIADVEQPATPGVHGTGLGTVTVMPADTTLNEEGVNRVPESAKLTFEVEVQNQGESEETDVGVSISIGNGEPIEVDQNITRIEAGDTQTISIPITDAPRTGAVTEVTVKVAAVPSEGVKENNKATYRVVFTKS